MRTVNNMDKWANGNINQPVNITSEKIIRKSNISSIEQSVTFKLPVYRDVVSKFCAR